MTEDASLQALERLKTPEHGIDPRAKNWWRLRALTSWGVITALLISGVVFLPGARAWLIAPLIFAGIVFLAKLLIEPIWRFRVHRWEITEHATFAVTGWLVREWRVAPTTRIQTVDAVRGPLEQALGLATLKVTTASSSGAIKISGLDHEVAQEAATRLAAVAEITEGDAT